MHTLYYEELHNLNSSPNVIKVFKSGRRWARHVACMGIEMHAKV